jgi:hypothetical protein
MAARTPSFGINHLTVIPENFDAESESDADIDADATPTPTPTRPIEMLARPKIYSVSASCVNCFQV